MHITAKKTIPILLLSSIVIVLLNYLSYRPTIQIAQAEFSAIPAELFLEILGTFILHSALVSAIPLVLSILNKSITSYTTLLILTAVYITIMTGINVAGPATATVILGYLAFYCYSKALDIYNYFRAK